MKSVYMLLLMWGIGSVLIGQEPPGLVTDRPDQTESSVVVPHKTLQIETGISLGGYLSARGKAAEKTENYLKDNYVHGEPGMVLWGIGNHGGGPSCIDIKLLKELKEKRDDVNIIDSIPEKYFAEVAAQKVDLPEVNTDLNAWAVGCYTSQIRIKQLYRQLENTLFKVEKMVTTAWVNGLLEYPEEELAEVSRCLAHAQFHDILPGSSIQPVEDTSIRLMNHALELLSRIKARAFFALTKGQTIAEEGEIPIMVFNPQAVAVDSEVECEFQLADQNWDDDYTDIKVYKDGELLDCQVEKELSNLTLDWRKHVVFRTTLQPGTMNRFDCKLQRIPEKVTPVQPAENQHIIFTNSDMRVIINTKTGLLDEYVVNGKSLLKESSFKGLVIHDNEDAWGMTTSSFTDVAGEFSLLDPQESAAHAGVKQASLPSVRIVEDGPVRTVVEAGFKFNESKMLVTYNLPKKSTEIKVDFRVNWNEKDKMLKVAIPTQLKAAEYLGQTAYGYHNLPTTGKEVVAQKWVAAVDSENAVAVINDGIYGSDCQNGEIRLSLLRSSAYSGHPIGERVIVPQDRFTCRFDQGERLYSFYLNGGAKAGIMPQVDSRALILNESPIALSFFPSGSGEKPKQLLEVVGDIELTACKKAEHSDDVIIRLFEPTGTTGAAVLKSPFMRENLQVELKPFEIKTFALNIKGQTWSETDLMEGLV